MNYCPVTDGQTDRRTESDAYEPTVQHAQVGSKMQLDVDVSPPGNIMTFTVTGKSLPHFFSNFSVAPLGEWHLSPSYIRAGGLILPSLSNVNGNYYK